MAGGGRVGAFRDIDVASVVSPQDQDALAGVRGRELDAMFKAAHRTAGRDATILLDATADDGLRIGLFVMANRPGQTCDLSIPRHDPSDLWSARPGIPSAAASNPRRVGRLSGETSAASVVLPWELGADVTPLIGPRHPRHLNIRPTLEARCAAECGRALSGAVRFRHLSDPASG